MSKREDQAMHTHTHTRLIFIYDDVYLAFIAIKEM